MAGWIEYKGFEQGQFSFAWWVWCLIAVYFMIPVVFYIFLPSFTNAYRRRLRVDEKLAVVCVLGDLGHSPRMINHTSSLLSHGYSVRLCGYLESELPQEILEDDDAEIYAITAIGNSYRLPYIVFGTLKVIHQFFSLGFLLLEVMENSRFIIIQNPPSIPLLLITVLLQKLWYRNVSIIIDWHNLNYSILNLRFKNEGHPVVRFVKLYERILAAYAYLNLTVSAEMGKFLIKDFGVDPRRTVPLYDRAPTRFQPLTDHEEKAEIIDANPEIFSHVANHHFKFDPSRDRILVSSTSFTPDEDFSVLLNALKLYDQAKNLPNVLLLVTGKGPLRQKFLQDVEQAHFSKVIVKNVWLSNEMYPRVLRIADLGISLHTSSSGVDLPMKIVDLFGSGVPVITLRFKAIGELVKHGENGLIVDNQVQMFEALQELFGNDSNLRTLRAGALEETLMRWDETWEATMGKVVE